FMSQQAAEKALKALYIYKIRDSPGKTHSLLRLGKDVGIPSYSYHGLRKLNPDFILTRYPDVADGVPYELYDYEIAQDKLQIAEEVIKWVEKELKK
ncbi:MAG: HEPN domain-containing protein, partial [Methanobacteriaceae archaeon]|nr:HEPN domain-containing protein [Methanobacteriaceae archaeon]